MKSFVMMLAGLAATGLAGCATDGRTDGDTDAPAQAQEVCLNDYQITGFDAVGDTHLYVAGIGDRHYLFTMERGCFGLRSAMTIGIPDRVGRICANSSDHVIYRDMARGLERCRILDIEQVTSREEARSIAEQREELRRKGN